MCYRSRPLLLALCLIGFALGCSAQQNSLLRVIVIDSHGTSIPMAEVHIVGFHRLGIPTPDGAVLFKEVPPGFYSLSVARPGFRDKVVTGVAVGEAKMAELTVTMESAPPKASDYKISEVFVSPQLYAKALTGISQPLLCTGELSQEKERYRFLWVPTFSQPVFFRIDVEADGTAQLLTYQWKGQGGYEWGIADKRSRKLTPEEEGELFYALADIGFWSLPATVSLPPDVIVLDGTEWFLEGVKDGKCHVVTRYSSPLNSFVASEFLGLIAKVKPYSRGER